jgi:hypothetical protein
MTWNPDDFEELAGQLRREVGGEFRAEAEEVERLTDLQRRRRAGLAEVAMAAMHRGDQVTVRTRSGTWIGELVAVGDDYISLQALDVKIEALVDAVALDLRPSRVGGRSGKPASATWRARLAELAVTQETVTVMAPDLGVEAHGQIDLVARDHVVSTGLTGRTYIPLISLTIVLRTVPS